MALDLWALAQKLRGCRFVDLTHAFDASIPHSVFFEPEQRTVLYDHAPARGSMGQGFLAHRYSFVGQWGTHVDPGVHFVPGNRFLDDIPVSEMVLPLVMIDIRAKVAQNADYCLSVNDLREWEALHGPMPGGAFVAKCSGWSARWPDHGRMVNRDMEGVAHFPGWTLEALRFIFEERGATACGHETMDTDPGFAVSRGDCSLEHYVLAQNRWQIELMANLAELPEAGALLVATWPKPKRGSGFPARVFAIVAA